MHQIALNYWQGNKENILKWLYSLFTSTPASPLVIKTTKCTTMTMSLDLKYLNSSSNPNLNETSMVNYLIWMVSSYFPLHRQSLSSLHHMILWKHRQCLYFMYGYMINFKSYCMSWQNYKWKQFTSLYIFFSYIK